jgi:hypothetical protein
MKYIILIIIFFNAWLPLYAQIEPVQSAIDELNTLRVKNVSSLYFPTRDTIESDGMLVLKKEYDDEGKIVEKYNLYVWDPVSNDNTTYYLYNGKGLLIETNTVKSVLNLNERDADYIHSFGDKPLYERVKYAYNAAGLLSQKEVFVSGDSMFSEDAVPNQVVLYSYQEGRLANEESSSPNKRIFNQNYNIAYVYDSAGNTVSKSVSYGEYKDKVRTTDYKYDTLGNLTEEKISDSAIVRNNVHYKYRYDTNGKLAEKLVYDPEVSDFVVEISYSYDQNGNRISGENNTIFTYYPNGLIRSEMWTDEISDRVFYFVTEYQYY